jgi:hypothetical protein
MRRSVVTLGRALDVPRELSASLDLRRKKLLRMSQQRGLCTSCMGPSVSVLFVVK